MTPSAKSYAEAGAILKLPVVPAAFFGMVLGLSGLGAAWGAARAVWGAPAAIGEGIFLLAGLVWVGLISLFAAKWIFLPSLAREEAKDPIQCCYIGLAGVATMLVAGGLLPYARGPASVLFAVGAVYTLGFAVWRTGGLWQGGRDPISLTAVLYLPSVAGLFVMGATAAAFGLHPLDQLAFGAGLFSWLAIESVLLNRLLVASPLSAPLRTTLGVQLAPPCVGALSYLSVAGGRPDLLAHMLIGYGLLQLLVLARLLIWIGEAPLNASY